jgi:hypothetical protein
MSEHHLLFLKLNQMFLIMIRFQIFKCLPMHWKLEYEAGKTVNTFLDFDVATKFVNDVFAACEAHSYAVIFNFL